MSKPNWKEVPEWVVWIAQDADGVWNGYNLEPSDYDDQWQRIDLNMFSGGKFITLERADPNQDWKNTLESRK